MSPTTRIPWHSGSHAINGFDQFCREWRPSREDAPPVLALHGSLTQSGMWIALAEMVATVRMMCPDQRGFGRSGDPGTDACADFAADALALARRSFAARYVVMGHSFACAIALETALRDEGRVAAVVLVDPVVRVGPAPAAAPPPSPPASFASLEEAARHFRATEEGDWSDAALGHLVRDIMIRDEASGRWRFPYTPARLARLRAFAASSASDYDLLAKAKGTRVPVLVFRGGASKRFPVAAEVPFLSTFPTTAELVQCPASGHFPTATEPGIVVAALKPFLARVG